MPNSQTPAYLPISPLPSSWRALPAWQALPVWRRHPWPSRPQATVRQRQSTFVRKGQHSPKLQRLTLCLLPSVQPAASQQSKPHMLHLGDHHVQPLALGRWHCRLGCCCCRRCRRLRVCLGCLLLSCSLHHLWHCDSPILGHCCSFCLRLLSHHQICTLSCSSLLSLCGWAGCICLLLPLGNLLLPLGLWLLSCSSVLCSRAVLSCCGFLGLCLLLRRGSCTLGAKLQGRALWATWSKRVSMRWSG